MAIINAVILPAKVLKDGRHKVRISVAHNGQTRYITTSIILDSAKEFRNGAIVKRPDAAYLNTKLRGLLQKYQEIIDGLDYVNGLTCPELIYQIQNGTYHKHRTLLSIYEEYVSSTHIKPSTARNYGIQWRAITKTVDGNMIMENVTRSTIIALNAAFYKRGMSSTSIYHYLAFFMALVRYSVRCGYVQYRIDPFIGFKLPEKEIRQAWLSVEEIKLIRDFKSHRRNMQLCRDLFMLSYYLGGINMIDLISINFNEHPKTLCYVRKKTENRAKANKFVQFDIPEEAKEIIKRLKRKDGHINASQSKNPKEGTHRFFDYNMPLMAKQLGLKKLIYYSARKSFAQHAFNLGVSTSIIDYILGHRVDKGGTSLYAYISVTPEMATKAIRKVLDNLK